MPPAGDADQPKHPPPEAPRRVVEAHQRQRFVELGKRLVDDGVPERMGLAERRSRERQDHGVAAPFDGEGLEAWLAEGPRRPWLDAGQVDLGAGG